ncbi:MAG TPA: hypothetical protein DEP72_05075, partial [Clostridiales bacterium]|nr:hypothetical protein [Clostridiales bacterium]
GNMLNKTSRETGDFGAMTTKNYDFSYNGYNQLVMVIDPEEKISTYTYDDSGLRMSKTVGEDVTNFYYDNGNIVLETDNDGFTKAKNTFVGSKIISRQTDLNMLYYLHDKHGDVTKLFGEITDPITGRMSYSVVKDYKYDAFGNEQENYGQVFGGKQIETKWQAEVNAVDNPFRYCGEYQDQEIGNIYLRARYYDPSIERFINEDTYWKSSKYRYSKTSFMNFQKNKYESINNLKNSTKMYNSNDLMQINNLYIYSLNNPVKYHDESGNNAAVILRNSWSVGGAASISDGPLPYGDVVGATIVAGGTVWATADWIGEQYKNYQEDQQSIRTKTRADTISSIKIIDQRIQLFIEQEMEMQQI